MEHAMYVWITTSFIGYHHWPEAPDEVAFLRNKHRHVFRVKLGVRTQKSREVEFILLKRRVDEFLRETYEEQTFQASCEQIAYTLMAKFDAAYVEVSEDGENGAFLVRSDNKE